MHATSVSSLQISRHVRVCDAGTRTIWPLCDPKLTTKPNFLTTRHLCCPSGRTRCCQRLSSGQQALGQRGQTTCALWGSCTQVSLVSLVNFISRLKTLRFGIAQTDHYPLRSKFAEWMGSGMFAERGVHAAMREHPGYTEQVGNMDLLRRCAKHRPWPSQEHHHGIAGIQ